MVLPTRFSQFENWNADTVVKCQILKVSTYFQPQYHSKFAPQFYMFSLRYLGLPQTAKPNWYVPRLSRRCYDTAQDVPRNWAVLLLWLLRTASPCLCSMWVFSKCNSSIPCPNHSGGGGLPCSPSRMIDKILSRLAAPYLGQYCTVIKLLTNA